MEKVEMYIVPDGANPEAYGAAGLRYECDSFTSAYCSHRGAQDVADRERQQVILRRVGDGKILFSCEPGEAAGAARGN